ncbi:enhanced serine sensitivity protein SseB [Paenibacillus senegalimassiliensis]|uniref:enhanced serine sensitivity protein SseB n=1 Tax=Paenibacillus senegalimassiliensis TaxID=1737426 RepID=UPI0009E7F0FF|nr:enhanced serine sensitivity protein SseB [Paenibacillus senegalimassiliensis]
MNEERKDEIGRRFILTPEFVVEELNQLSIQELNFLVHTAKRFKEEEAFPHIYLDERIQSFTTTLHDKFKAAEALYVAYDKATQYPYIDGEGRVWIFSQKEFADSAQDYFMQQLVMLEMKKIGQKEILPILGLFHVWGLPEILLDNGQYHVDLKRDELLPPPDWSGTPEINIPVTNPGLQRALLQFFQGLHAPSGSQEAREQLLNGLEAQMLDEVLQARYLLPMQLQEANPSTADAEGRKTLKEGTVLQFGVLSAEDESSWLPAFTDWPEFEKVYDKTIWSSNIGTYEDLLTVSANMSGVVINCRGVALRIDPSNRERIEAYRKARDSAGENGAHTADQVTETVEKVVVPKDTKVLLGEPANYPTAMIEAVKSCLKTQKSVSEAYLRLMVQGETQSYLLIVDTNDEPEAVFGAISSAAAPHLQGMPLNLVKLEGTWAEEAANLTPFYKKKRFGLF